MSNEGTGVVYGNVGVLDIRAADEAALRRVRRIGNLGALVHGPGHCAAGEHAVRRQPRLHHRSGYKLERRRCGSMPALRGPSQG